MFREPTWWAWLVCEGLLIAGALGFRAAFGVAILFALSQFVYFASADDEKLSLAAQVRLGFAMIVAGADSLGAHWLIWMLIAGTAVRILFGYCLLGRILSLLPWNREIPLTYELARRTFLTPPARVAPDQSPIGVAAQSLDPCSSKGVVAATRVRACDAEAQIAKPVVSVVSKSVGAMERAVRDARMRRVRMALDWCQENPLCAPCLTARQELDSAS